MGPGGCGPGRSCWPGSGAKTLWATRGWWIFTWDTCGRNSTTTNPVPAGWKRWGTETTGGGVVPVVKGPGEKAAVCLQRELKRLQARIRQLETEAALHRRARQVAEDSLRAVVEASDKVLLVLDADQRQIGRAACRERVSTARCA